MKERNDCSSMLINKMSRRKMLLGSMAVVAGTAGSGRKLSLLNPDNEKDPFPLSLNTSTISGYNLPVTSQVELCAEAGFDGIELWMKDIERYVRDGGSLRSLADLLTSSGLILYNIIGFAPWLAGDDGMTQMKKEMDVAAALNSRCIAATAMGLGSINRRDFELYSECYRQLLIYGDEVNVQPLLEIWGAGVLNKLSDAIHIAIGAGHPKASFLLDFYHLYRGTNSLDILHVINGAILPVFHINDYPATPSRNELSDVDRVYPGDGICPFNKILPQLYDAGFRGALSLELFNPEYWKPDIKTALKTGYDKVVFAIKKAMLV